MHTWDIPSLDVAPHRPEVLRSGEDARAISITLPAGELLQDHQVHERAWLMVAEGSVELRTDRNGAAATAISAGGLAMWDPGERHEVRAREDARLVLLLTPWPGEGHPSLREAGGATA